MSTTTHTDTPVTGRTVAGTRREQEVTVMSNDQPISLTPQDERHSNRTAWTAVIVVALVALLAAVIFYAKQSRDREDQRISDYACAMQADANGASSWQVVDGRCVIS